MINAVVIDDQSESYNSGYTHSRRIYAAIEISRVLLKIVFICNLDRISTPLHRFQIILFQLEMLPIRKQKYLTVDEKMDDLNMMNEGKSYRAVAHHFGGV